MCTETVRVYMGCLKSLTDTPSVKSSRLVRCNIGQEKKTKKKTLLGFEPMTAETVGSKHKELSHYTTNGCRF